MEDNYYDSEEDSDYNLEEDCDDYDDYNSEEDLGDEDEDEGSTYKNLHKLVKANKTTKITNTSMYYLYLYLNEMVSILNINIKIH